MSKHFLGGLFVGSHAVSEGFLTRHQLQNGPFVRVLHGVYADVSVPRDHLLKVRAAALLAPPEAVVAGRSAAAVLGAPEPDYRDPVTLILPVETPWRGPRGIRVHRAELAPSEVQTAGGLRITTPLRTAWDVAALESTATAVGVLDAMVHTGMVTVAELMRLLSTSGGRWGAKRARRAFELVDGRSESPPESWVRVACFFARLPAPIPQHDVIENGVWLGRGDLVWPEARLIVEYEGEYHFDELQIDRDDERLQRFVAAGWRVIRLAAHDLRDMDAVVRRVAEALALVPAAA